MSFKDIVETSLASPRYARERLRSMFDRLETGNALFNCFVRTYPSNLDRCASEAGLCGLAYAAKDCFDLRGAAPSLGMDPPALKKSDADAALIVRLSQLGACLFASTNMDELGLSSSGENRCFGDVRNPLNRRELAGGSSGGSAAAVAAGLVDFALGSDFGGSVRIPAARCGIWGLKLTPGSTLADGMFAHDPAMDTPGLMAASGADLAYLAEALLEPAQDRAERRMLLCSPADLALAGEPAASHFERFAANLPPLEGSTLSLGEAAAARKILAAKAAACSIERLGIPAKRLGDAARATALLGASLDAARVEAARAELNDWCARLGALLASGAIILTPGHPCDELLYAANVCGLPALAFPAPQRHTTLQLQLVGPPRSELKLIAIGESLASAKLS